MSNELDYLYIYIYSYIYGPVLHFCWKSMTCFQLNN